MQAILKLLEIKHLLLRWEKMITAAAAVAAAEAGRNPEWVRESYFLLLFGLWKHSSTEYKIILMYSGRYSSPTA